MAQRAVGGLTQDRVHRSWLFAEHFGLEHGFDRYPLLRGHLTGSRDGKAVAPFLGTITGYDGRATDWHLGPLTFALAYCDHVVIYRFAPRGQFLTDCEIHLARERKRRGGKGLPPREPAWLWDVTDRIADKTIIERNQAGVDSRYYVPGPLSPPMEYFTQQFLDWYIRRNAAQYHRRIARSAARG
jgi:Rieske 2Fe-2S family protein